MGQGQGVLWLCTEVNEFWWSLKATGKKRESSTLPPVVWLWMLVCCLNFMCFAAASWILQEDLAEHKETCVDYCPAVLQLLLHSKNVDTFRESLSPSSYSGWLVHSRKW